MVRKSTVHRNPIGSTSEALQRQRSRQSLRRQIMDASNDGMTMNTETLLEFNPKLADVSHSTRIAYAKFMTTKLKKEIKFENDKIEIENEIVRARETKAFNKFKTNAGILKRTVEKAVVSETILNSEEPQVETLAATNEGTSKDFRARTPIEEDPYEDIQTPDRSLTPENILDEMVNKIPTTISTPPTVPSEHTQKTTSDNRTHSELQIESPEPTTIKFSDSSTAEKLEKETEKDEDTNKLETVQKDLKTSQLSVPSSSSRPSSPSYSISTGDKGKSKITGKTLTGWI